MKKLNMERNIIKCVVFTIIILINSTALSGIKVYESNWESEIGPNCSVDDSGLWPAVRGDGCPYSPSAPFYIEKGTGPRETNALKTSAWRLNQNGVSYSYVEIYTDYPGAGGFYDQSGHRYSYSRLYMKVDSTIWNDIPDARRFHLFENKHKNATNFYWGIFSPSASTWRAYIESFAHRDVYESSIGYILSTKWLLPGLPYDEWLRIEMMIDWRNDYDSQAHTLTYWRVYNSSGTLIADNDDIIPDNYNPNGICDPAHGGDDCTLTEFYNAGYHWVWTGDQFGMKIGDNGPATLPVTREPVHIADFAAFKWTESDSPDDWIGGIEGGQPSTPPSAPKHLKIMAPIK